MFRHLIQCARMTTTSRTRRGGNPLRLQHLLNANKMMWNESEWRNKVPRRMTSENYKRKWNEGKTPHFPFYSIPFLQQNTWEREGCKRCYTINYFYTLLQIEKCQMESWRIKCMLFPFYNISANSIHFWARENFITHLPQYKRKFIRSISGGFQHSLRNISNWETAIYRISLHLYKCDSDMPMNLSLVSSQNAFRFEWTSVTPREGVINPSVSHVSAASNDTHVIRFTVAKAKLN